jgi:hypothetical protein
MTYDVQKIRNQLRNKLSTRPQDPFEFRPPKAKKDETLKLRFYVLTPLVKGDKCHGGTASRSMDDLFCIKHGNHWVNNKPHACPRVNRDEPCELCDAGFDMLRETDDKDKRRAIIQNWLSQSVYLVNIYFPNIQSNPEALRGKVMFFNAPKTCFDQWYAAVNRDTGGDEADPEAFGVFYDPENAYLYQLEIVLNGNNNSYKTSKFLAQMGPHPIARLKDGSADSKRIQTLLDQRHDLATKIEEPNPDKIRKLCNSMLNGTDVDDDQAGSEEATQPATPPPARSATTAGPAARTTQATAPAKPGTRPAPAKPSTRPAPAPEPEPEPGTGDESTLEPELPEGNGEALEPETEAEAPPPAPKKPAQKPPQRPATTTTSKAPVKAPAKAPVKAPVKAPAAAAEEDDSEIDRLLGELTPQE